MKQSDHSAGSSLPAGPLPAGPLPKSPPATENLDLSEHHIKGLFGSSLDSNIGFNPEQALRDAYQLNENSDEFYTLFGSATCGDSQDLAREFYPLSKGGNNSVE